jgi:hypothetical protein
MDITASKRRGLLKKASGVSTQRPGIRQFTARYSIVVTDAPFVPRKLRSYYDDVTALNGVVFKSRVQRRVGVPVIRNTTSLNLFGIPPSRSRCPQKPSRSHIIEIPILDGYRIVHREDRPHVFRHRTWRSFPRTQCVDQATDTKPHTHDGWPTHAHRYLRK